MDEVKEKNVEYEAVEAAKKSGGRQAGMIVGARANHRPRRAMCSRHHRLHHRPRAALLEHVLAGTRHCGRRSHAGSLSPTERGDNGGRGSGKLAVRARRGPQQAAGPKGGSRNGGVTAGPVCRTWAQQGTPESPTRAQQAKQEGASAAARKVKINAPPATPTAPKADGKITWDWVLRDCGAAQGCPTSKRRNSKLDRLMLRCSLRNT